jgi:hypothetical protein
MSDLKPPLRLDSPTYSAFLMARQSDSFEEKRARAVEWVLATWMNLVDPNIMGVRRVEEERNGQLIPMIHIAIPLGYQRRQLARTLDLKQIEDSKNTPRVNLASSNGFDESHSFIRVPADIVLGRFTDFLQSASRIMEINDETIGAPEEAVEDFIRNSQPKTGEDVGQLRSSLRHALAMRNAAIPPESIQILTDKNTREKWIRIRNVERSVRTSLKLAMKQAGIQRAAPPKDDGGDSDWAILFPLSEARKLLRR